ncbi:hypothetical protein RRF57_005682 [Xylaria bambusicola]|uniref:Uncharacterized protein n=1 Tax=Xylaria bambusicola TaxID=326684 RepID=A0AAN7UIA0_9PEZI
MIPESIHISLPPGEERSNATSKCVALTARPLQSTYQIDHERRLAVADEVLPALLHDSDSTEGLRKSLNLLGFLCSVTCLVFLVREDAFPEAPELDYIRGQDDLAPAHDNLGRLCHDGESVGI